MRRGKANVLSKKSKNSLKDLVWPTPQPKMSLEDLGLANSPA